MIICTGLTAGASARASAATTISETKTAENCLNRMRVCAGISDGSAKALKLRCAL